MEAWIAKDKEGNFFTGTLSTDKEEALEIMKALKAKQLTLAKVLVQEID